MSPTSRSTARTLGLIVLFLALLAPFSTSALAAQDDVDTDHDTVNEADDNCVDDFNPAQLDADDDDIGNACDDLNDDDVDGDLIPNDRDNCPDTANTGQTDWDHDDLGDACDATPQGEDVDTETSTETNTDTSTDTDTVTTTSLPDSDDDDVTDDIDTCPLDPNPEQANADGDRLGDACDPTPDGGAVPGDSDGDFVPDDVDNCPDIANTTQLDTDGDGDGIGDACDTADEPDGALVTVAMTAPEQVAAPGTITYDLTVTSTTDGLNTVILSSELPRGDALDWSTSTPGCRILDVRGQERLMCPRIVFMGNGESFTATVSSAISDDASLCDTTLTANAIADSGQGEPVTSDPASTTVVCKTTLNVVVWVEAGRSGPEINPGEQFNLFMGVSNTGDLRAVDLEVTAPVPAGFTLTSVPGRCSAGPTSVTCRAPSLDAGRSHSWGSVITVPEVKTICGQHNLSVTGSAANADEATNTSTFEVACPPIISISASGPATIIAGDDLTYTITVENTGFGKAAGVGFTDDLPAIGLEWTVTAPETLPDGVTCPITEGTLECSGIALDPVNGTFALTVKSDTSTNPGSIGCGGELANVATLTTHGKTESNSASTTVTCSAAVQACLTAASAAKIDPVSFNLVPGDEGNNVFTGAGTDGADLFCGFGGTDTMHTLVTGDVLLGGNGNDTVTDLNGGTFNGGTGTDRVSYQMNSGTFNGGDGADGIAGQNGGIFNGAAGNDGLDYLYSGTFNGGGGDDGANYLNTGGTFNGGANSDDLGVMHDGVFNGGAGNDSVSIEMMNGTFNGGDGYDRVETLTNGTFDGWLGSDTVSTMTGGRFDGWQGMDTVGTMTGGRFNGGRGNDAVTNLGDPDTGGDGTFNASFGADHVENLSSGTFDGGHQNDTVGTMTGGNFDGMWGADSVGTMNAGSFDGAWGADTVTNLNGGFFNGSWDADTIEALGSDADSDNYANVENVP